MTVRIQCWQFDSVLSDAKDPTGGSPKKLDTRIVGGRLGICPLVAQVIPEASCLVKGKEGWYNYVLSFARPLLL